MANIKWTPIIKDTSTVNKVNEILSFIKNSKKNEFASYDLMYGDIGVIIYRYYYSFLLGNDEEQNDCLKRLEASINQLNNNASNLTFGKGLTGILWGIMHLKMLKALDIEISEIVDDDFFDRYNEICEGGMRNNDYDYLLGVGGAFLLFLELEMDTQINVLLKLLYANAVVDGDNIFWNQSPVLGKTESSLTINLGLAHGIPSILSILCIISKRYNNQHIKDIVYKSFKWLQKNHLNPSTHGYFFPFTLSKSREPYSTSLRWCYGDLGVSISMINVGQIFGISEIYNFGMKIAHNCAERKIETDSIVDAHLCHGTVGIAHIFNRLYNYTGDNIFLKSSQYWFDETINRFDGSLASGFKAWKGDYGWVEFDGLLEGSAGIGLALISAISDIEPKWDRCLLLS